MTNPNSARDVDGLIEVLRDPDARVDERDDAAMDLGDSDDPVALQALLDVSRDRHEHVMVLESVGESLAAIALRNSSFDRSWLDGMMTPAVRELTSALGLPPPDDPKSSDVF